MESTQGKVLERITLMINIKSRENLFLNSWFESLHKRYDQHRLNDPNMQILNTQEIAQEMGDKSLNQANEKTHFSFNFKLSYNKTSQGYI